MTDSEVRIVFVGSSGDAVAATEKLDAALKRLKRSEDELARAQVAQAAAAKTATAQTQRSSAAQTKATKDSQTAEMRRLQMIEQARNQMTRDFNEQRARELAMRQDLDRRLAAETQATIRQAANAQREAAEVKRSVDSQLRDRARQAAAEARNYEQERRHDLQVSQARQMMDRDLASRLSSLDAFSAGLRRNSRDADANTSAYKRLDSVIHILPNRLTLLGAAIGTVAAAGPGLVGALAAAAAVIPSLAGGIGLAVADVKSLGLGDISSVADKLTQTQTKLAATQDAIQKKLAAGQVTAKQAAKESATAQINAAKQTQIAMAGLTSEQRAALPTIRAYKDITSEAAKSIQHELLPALGALAPTVKSVAPVIESGMLGAAKEIKGAAQEAAAFAQTPLFKRDLATLMHTSASALGQTLSVVGHLTDAMLGANAAAAPFEQRIGGAFVGWSRLLDSFTHSAAGEQQIHSLLQNGITDLDHFSRAVGVIAQTIGRFGIAATPALRAFADEIHHVIGGLDTFVGANQQGISMVLLGITNELHALISYIESNGDSIGTILANGFKAAETAAHAFNDTMELAGPGLSAILGAVASLSSAIGPTGLVALFASVTIGATAFKGAMAGIGAAVAASTVELGGAEIALAAAGGALAAFANPLIAIPAAIIGLGALLHVLGSDLGSTQHNAQAAADALQNLHDEILASKDANLQAQVSEHRHSQAVHELATAHEAARGAVVQRNAAESDLAAAIARQTAVEVNANSSARARAKAQADVAAADQKVKNTTADVATAYTTLQNANDSVRESELGVAAAHDKARSEADKLTASHRKAADAFLKTEKAARASADELFHTSLGAVAVARGNASVATSANEVARRQAAANAALQTYIASNNAATGPMAAVNHALADLAGDLGKIPSKKVTDMVLNEILHGDSPAKIASDIAALHSKSVVIDITTQQQTFHHGASQTGPVKRASGGGIPGMPSRGDVVPALLTAGEVVLKPHHQALIGHHVIADALRSTGAPNVPRFASGSGPVPLPKKGPLPPHNPPKLPHHSARLPHVSVINDKKFPFSVDPRSVLGKSIDTILGELAAVTLQQTGLDDAQKAYDLLVRQYDAETPSLTKTIQDPNWQPDPNNPGDQPSTLEVRDEQGITQRVAQLRDLINKRSAMEGMLAVEGGELQQAVADISAAMTKLADAIKKTAAELKEEKKAEARFKELEHASHNQAAKERVESRDDFTHAHELRDKASNERQKGKKANVKQINAWESEARAISSQARDHATEAIHQDQLAKGYGEEATRRSTNIGRLEKRMSALQSASTSYGSQRDSLSNTLLHELPFAERGFEIDVEELNNQIGAVLGTQSQTSTPGQSTAPGGSGVGGSGADTSALDQQIIAQLQQQLAQANTALGVQRAQLPVLASFRSGVMHVPEDMVAELHAGERVVRAGVSPAIQAAPAAAGGELQVRILLDQGGVGQLLQAEIVKATPGIFATLGDMADTRRREGRY